MVCSENNKRTELIVHFSYLRETSKTFYLINFVPLGIETFFYCFAVKQLVADLQDTVWVGLALDQPSQKVIFSFQILGLQEVNP